MSVFNRHEEIWRQLAGELQGQFAVVTCDGAVPELHELFVRCFLAALPCGFRSYTAVHACARGVPDLREMHRKISLIRR